MANFFANEGDSLLKKREWCTVEIETVLNTQTRTLTMTATDMLYYQC
jgi:hypothetical protein